MNKSHTKMKSTSRISAAALLLTTLSLLLHGCGSGVYQPEIDLDRVLEVFTVCLQTPVDPNSNATASRDATPTNRVQSTIRIVNIPPEEQDNAKNQAFLTLFADQLNQANLHKTKLGVRQDTSGAIIGFTDADGNMTKDGKDKDLFTIQLDPDRNRVIATDLQDKTIHRSSHYHGYYHHHRSGFWTGYMLGSMNGSQDSYYRRNPSQRTDYSRMSMAPQGYAKPNSSFRAARAASARSMGGSRSFKGGK